MKEVVITNYEDGEKLIRFLQKTMPDAGSGFLYKMLRKKNITVNKKKCDGKEVLHSGDHVQIFFSDETYKKMGGREFEEDNATSKENKSLDFGKLSTEELDEIKQRILYEDEDYLFINKKRGELSQKATEKDVSLNEKLISYLLSSKKLDEEILSHFRPSVINRLDRNTSGVLLFGKSMKALQNGGEMMRSHDGNKIYHCITGVGKKFPFTEEWISIEGYLKKDSSKNLVTYYRLSEGNEQDMLYMKQEVRLIKRNKDLALLEVMLYTGRSHQIRASLKAFDAPVLMDPKYGDKNLNEHYGKIHHLKFGQLLHASSIDFPGVGLIKAEEPEFFDKIMNEN